MILDPFLQKQLVKQSFSTHDEHTEPLTLTSNKDGIRIVTLNNPKKR